MPKLYLKKSVILGGKMHPPEAEIDVSKKVCDQLIDAGAGVPMTEYLATKAAENSDPEESE